MYNFAIINFRCTFSIPEKRGKRFPSKQYYFSIIGKSRRKKDRRTFVSFTRRPQKRRHDYRENEEGEEEEIGRKRERGVFLTSVLGGARNAILMKNAESTRIPAHSY